MEDGGWRIEDGGWRDSVFCASFLYPPSSVFYLLSSILCKKNRASKPRLRRPVAKVKKFYYEATFGVKTQKSLDPKVLIASVQWKLNSALGFPQIRCT